MEKFRTISLLASLWTLNLFPFCKIKKKIYPSYGSITKGFLEISSSRRIERRILLARNFERSIDLSEDASSLFSRCRDHYRWTLFPIGRWIMADRVYTADRIASAYISRRLFTIWFTLGWSSSGSILARDRDEIETECAQYTRAYGD